MVFILQSVSKLKQKTTCDCDALFVLQKKSICFDIDIYSHLLVIIIDNIIFRSDKRLKERAWEILLLFLL